MIDFHSHIIPKIDDGSKSEEMSAEMLQLSFKQGVTHIVATPHFYINDNDAEQFLINRSHCLKKLDKVLDDSMPKIYVGAEVYFFNGISQYKDLDKLTINNSKYILIEMPFMQWNERIIKEIENIIYDRGFKVIIAHIERYLDFQKGTSNINELLALNPIIQMNAEYINGFFTRKKALNFINDNIAQLIGSDCHNMTTRMPNLDKAYDYIEKKLGIDVVNKINNLGKSILNID